MGGTVGMGEVACVHCGERVAGGLVARAGGNRWSVCSRCGSTMEWSSTQRRGEPDASEAFYDEVRALVTGAVDGLRHLHDEWNSLAENDRRRIARNAADRSRHMIDQLLPVLVALVHARTRRREQ